MSVLAVVSLVAGIVWIFGLGSVVAIVCGAIALSQIRQRGLGGRGLAVAGIALGVAGVLGAILTFALIGAVDEAAEDVTRSLDERATAPVTVHVEAGPRVCWSATLSTGGIFTEGGSGQSSREGCGSSTFPLGPGSGRNVVLHGKFDSQPGTIAAWLTVNGVAQPRQHTTAPSGGFITLAP